jgi:hypothetical protein
VRRRTTGRALGIEQFGEGLKGAARTAAFLAQEGIDAYLAELPRIGVDKIDLDDYLGSWSDTLAPVLAGAKPGTQHPAYEVSTVGNSNDEFTGIGGGGGGSSEFTPATTLQTGVRTHTILPRRKSTMRWTVLANVVI